MSGVRTACAVLLIGLIGGSAVAAAPLRPDLVESAVSVSQHGRTLRVTDIARNRGETAAPASRTGYYLARRQIGSRSVGPLRARTRSRGSKTLTIPLSVPPGSWRLLACADARARIHESDERNNCRAATQPVEVGDDTPPRFAGLIRATTCIPGPVGGTVRYSHYFLQWEPAADNVTPQSEILYEIYDAHASGGEDFSSPTYTTPPGATSFTTPLLPDNVSHYFVVRAMDKAGNRDANKVERLGTNLCL